MSRGYSLLCHRGNPTAPRRQGHGRQYPFGGAVRFFKGRSVALGHIIPPGVPVDAALSTPVTKPQMRVSDPRHPFAALRASVPPPQFAVRNDRIHEGNEDEQGGADEEERRRLA